MSSISMKGLFCASFLTSVTDHHLEIPNEYVSKLNDSILCENLKLCQCCFEPDGSETIASERTL